jgi:hypothetical protein
MQEFYRRREEGHLIPQGITAHGAALSGVSLTAEGRFASYGLLRGVVTALPSLPASP